MSSHSRSVSHHKPGRGHNGGNGAPRHAGKAAEVIGNGSCGAAAGNSWPEKSRRSRVERWVLTQQALYAERRLSMGQIRYLALLGKLVIAMLPQHTQRRLCSTGSTVEELQIHRNTSAADCSLLWASSGARSQKCHLHFCDCDPTSEAEKLFKVLIGLDTSVRGVRLLVKSLSTEIETTPWVTR